MMTRTADTQQIIDECSRLGWDLALHQVAGIPRDCLDGSHGPCPKCGGTDRWRFTNHNNEGGAICNQCEKLGDGIAVAMWYRGWSFMEAKSKFAEALGIATRKKTATKGNAIDPLDRIEVLGWADATARLFCLRKPGITPDGMVACGTECVRYRFGANSFICFGIRVLGEAFDIEHPVGFWIIDSTAGELPAKAKDGVRFKKHKLTFGSQQGIAATTSLINAIRDKQDLSKETVYKVEGFPDLMAIASQNEDVLAFTDSNGTDATPPQWFIDRLASLKPSVFVIPDSDKPGQKGAEKYANQLAKKCSNVRIVPLPYQVAESRGQDLRDYFVDGHSLEDLIALALKAEQYEPSQTSDNTPATSKSSGTIDEGLEDLLPFENPTDPARLARLNVSRYEERFNAKLVYWQAQWWRWRYGRWTHLSTDEIDAKVRVGIDEELTLIAESEEAAGQKNPQKKSISTAMVRNVIDAMKSQCFLPGRVEMPSWLDDDKKHRKFVAVGNGLFDIDALLCGFRPEDCLIPHSSNWFAAVNLEFDFEPGATAERWLQYIESSLPEPKAQLLAQEWAGYLLLSGNPYQRFMTCEGEGGTGKSVYVAGCTALLNPLSVSHAELREFGSRFGLADTIGKAMNVDSDVQQDAKFSEGGFKKFCIGERMSFEFKGGKSFSHRPTAKVMLAWNERPRIKDTSNGFWRRMLLLSFERVVPKSEIVRGLDQPEWWIESGELPGILNWALEGLQRLASQGGFTEPESMQKLIREYRRDQNPVQGFLDEMVQQWEPTSKYPEKDFEFQSTRGLVAAFRDWCDDNASPADAEAMTPRKMGWAVRKKFPGIESDEKNDSDEGHVRGYKGIKILTIKELQEEKNSLREGKLF